MSKQRNRKRQKQPFLQTKNQKQVQQKQQKVKRGESAAQEKNSPKNDTTQKCLLVSGKNPFIKTI